MKKAVLIVSFGSSNIEAYKLIEKFRNKISSSLCEDVYVQCVFTSNILIKRMKEKNNIEILNISEALEMLWRDGCREVVLQPLHMMDGKDCDSLRNIINDNKNRFDKININNTLLINKGCSSMESSLNIVNSIKDNVDKDRNVVMVGHGSNRCSDYCCYNSIMTDKSCISNTKAESCNDDCYLEIERAFKSIGYNNVIIGTLEGNRRKDNVLEELIEKGIDNVVIMPLLVLPGNHIINDIKGEGSWESLFNDNNIKTEVKLKSLLEYEGIQKLYIDMIKESFSY